MSLRIRDVHPADRGALLALSHALDSVNLPAEPDAVDELIDRSRRSFDGALPRHERIHVFVLEDGGGELVGTSLVIAQHGTPDLPHVFFELHERHHVSESLGVAKRHPCVEIRFDEDGPTELGGLVVDPRRRGEDRPGKQLSFVRFLYIAMHRSWFRDRLLAEMLPPFGPDGHSVLWEHLGRHLTGMSYREADRLSRRNKEFIRGLFPDGPIYLSWFPERVTAELGEVAPATVPARRMLERLGFRWHGAIDPFDGGPHLEADCDAVSLIRDHRRLPVVRGDACGAGEDVLVAVAPEGGPHRFLAARGRVWSVGRGVVLEPSLAERLGVGPGADVHLIPFVTPEHARSERRDHEDRSEAERRVERGAVRAEG